MDGRHLQRDAQGEAMTAGDRQKTVSRGTDDPTGRKGHAERGSVQQSVGSAVGSGRKPQDVSIFPAYSAGMRRATLAAREPLPVAP